MGRDLTQDLTKQYASFFGKKGLKKLYHFGQDVYRSGKLREIISFLVWEVLHRLGLFAQKDYLQFSAGAPLTLGTARLAGAEFGEKLAHRLGAQGLTVGRCERNWKLVVIKPDQELWGCLYPNDCDLCKSPDNGQSVVFVHRFPERIKAIFVSSQQTLFVCVKGAVYRSSDQGISFTRTLELGSTESFFRFNNAMTETPNQTLVIGEYGNIWDQSGWRILAYLYFSTDDGVTWRTSDFLIQQGTNKHVHIVKYSPLLNRLMVADGDNYKKLWVSAPLDKFDLNNPQWHAVNRFHIQMGGYTAVVESQGKVFFGTDYQGGTNFLVESTDGQHFTKKVIPDPYRRSPIDNMVLRKAKHGTEIWANLPFSTANSRCLLMYSADGGQSWHRVIEYNRATHTVWLTSSANEPTDTIYFSVENTQNNHRVVYKVSDQ